MNSTVELIEYIKDVHNVKITNITLPRSIDSAYTELETLLLTIVLPMILIGSLFGNVLLMTSIIRLQELRKHDSIFLIFNLAVCDLITTAFSIPVSLVTYHVPSYPLGEVGCKVLWPIATYGVNANASTLICIAIERFIAICVVKYRLSRRSILCMIAAIHTIAFASVIPYSYHLVYRKLDNRNYCYEEWAGSAEQKQYTVSLFLLQYGMPLVTMIVLYSLVWWKIFKQNQKMIQLSEEYERKMAWEKESGAANENGNQATKKTTKISFSSVENNTDIPEKEETFLTSKQNTPNITITTHSKVNTPEESAVKVHVTDENDNMEILQNDFEKRGPDLCQDTEKHPTKRLIKRNSTIKLIRKTFHKFHKPNYVSHTAYVRHKQTVRTLTMFTTVVIVFLVLALPNQIVWLMKDFNASHKINVYVAVVFHLLTYVNPVVNCWIYAGFNKGFMKAYKNILKDLLTCGRDQQNQYQSLRQRSKSNTSYKTETYYDSEQEQMFAERTNIFTEMFKQHYENFDQFKHLYSSANENNGEHFPSAPTPQRKRKITLAGVLNAFTPGRKFSTAFRSSDRLNKPNKTKDRKYSLFPPIVPFVQQNGNPRPKVRKQSRTSSTSSANSTLLEIMIQEKKRRSSTPGRYVEVDELIELARKRSTGQMVPRQRSVSQIEPRQRSATMPSKCEPFPLKLSPRKVVKRSIPSISIVDTNEINVQELNIVKDTLFQVKRQADFKNIIAKYSPIMKRKDVMKQLMLDETSREKRSPRLSRKHVPHSNHLHPEYIQTDYSRTPERSPQQKRKALESNNNKIENYTNLIDESAASSHREPQVKTIAFNPMEMIIEETVVRNGLGIKAERPTLHTAKTSRVEQTHVTRRCECKMKLEANHLQSCSHVNQAPNANSKYSITHLNSSKLVAKHKSLYDEVPAATTTKKTKSHSYKTPFDISIGRRKKAVFLLPNLNELEESKLIKTSAKKDISPKNRFTRKTSLSAHVQANLQNQGVAL